MSILITVRSYSLKVTLCYRYEANGSDNGIVDKSNCLIQLKARLCKSIMKYLVGRTPCDINCSFYLHMTNPF